IPYRAIGKTERLKTSEAVSSGVRFYSLLLFRESPTHSKHMPVRMPQMHLAHIPRHVVRWKRHFDPSGDALLVNRVHILDPHGHPRALIRRFVSIHLKRRGIRSLPSSTLRAQTKENLALA